jgi:perosamine synthetase
MAYPRQRVYLPLRAWRGFFSHLLTGKLFSGSSIQQFEKLFANLIGAKYAIAVPSGRKGLQNALAALNLTPGAEVIVPAFTYPAVPYIIQESGYNIRFVDIDMLTFGIDPIALEKLLSSNTKAEAIIPTHLYGVPCDIEIIQKISKQHGLYIIEDCAHCGITSVNAKNTGSFSDIAYFSFETSKSINTLGGGMLMTSQPELAEKLRNIQNKADKGSITHLLKRLLKSSFEALVTQPILFSLFVYPALRLINLMTQADDVVSKKYIGQDITLKGRTFSYSNYQAWLGLQQLTDLKIITQRRVNNANYLLQQLKTHIQCQSPLNIQHKPNWLLFSILVKNKEKIASILLTKGIDTKRNYMRDCSQIFKKGGYPNAARVDQELLHIPCYPELSEQDLSTISQQLLLFVNNKS